jgi:DNA end-binding protein Ku
MPAHAIGSATISFGLVSVPIQMYSAGEASATVSFNWLHKDCGTRLKQQYYCPKDEVVVEKDDMIKGYEFSKGQYVLFTPDELKELGEKGTGSIDVREFVEESQVDRRYVDKTYFLGPGKGGERAYRLLAEALKKTGRVALGQYAARGKQYLILLRPLEDGLAMEQLRYANEVRSIAEVPIPKVELKKNEIDLAVQFVEQGKADAFNPESYEDNVRKRQLEQIQRKVDGKEITEEPEEAPKTQILDLMEALKASLKGAKPAAAAPEKKKAAKRKAG